MSRMGSNPLIVVHRNGFQVGPNGAQLFDVEDETFIIRKSDEICRLTKDRSNICAYGEQALQADANQSLQRPLKAKSKLTKLS